MVICFFPSLRIRIFLRVLTFSLSFLKNHKERRLMLLLLLASTFSELACLWFATWGLEFYWARKASFFWIWCTKEREQLCFLSGWKMWHLLVIYSIFINITYKLKPLNQRGNNQGLCCVFLISLRDTVASAYCSFLK